MSRSMYYYQSGKDDTEVENKIIEWAIKKPSRGLPYFVSQIRKEGYNWNHKRIGRVYRNLNLNKRRKKPRRRLPPRLDGALWQPSSINQMWSMDFMHDRLVNGRKIRVLNIIDDYNREALMIDVAHSQSGESVVRAIRQIIEWRGKPQRIRCDNGPEFLSNMLVDFCNEPELKIKLEYTQPGKPNQNAYIERFNRTFREDVLDAYLFESIEQVRILAQDWMEDYNQNHPHQSLEKMSPLDYLKFYNNI